MKNYLKSKYILIIAAIVFLLFPLAIPREKIVLTNEEGKFTISHGKVTALNKDVYNEISFALDEITGIRLITDPDFGKQVDAIETDTCLSGVWNNEEYQDYNLYTYRASEKCVEISLENGERLVLGLESTDMTSSFYEALDKYLSDTD